jgi:peptidoglycan/LPS O-acetylase OafA/YrhL
MDSFPKEDAERQSAIETMPMLWKTERNKHEVPLFAHRRLHLEAADGIRAVACLWVLVVHSFAIIYPKTNPYLSGCGKIGVWLFFVLSAYLLTHGFLLRGFSQWELLNYSVKRFLRIIPPFAVAVFAYRYLGTAGIDSSKALFKALSLREGFSHLWTIPVEFKFYFILPLIAWLSVKVSEKFKAKGVVLATACLIAIHQLIYPFYDLEENTIATRWYLPCFLLGISAAFFNSRISAKVATAIGVGAIACVLMSTPFMRLIILDIPPSNYLMNKYLLIGFFWTLFVISQTASLEISGLPRLLACNILRLIGKWSYSIYLCHWYFAHKIYQYFPENVFSVIAVIASAICFGALMFYIVEKPTQELRGFILRKFTLKTGVQSIPVAPET